MKKKNIHNSYKDGKLTLNKVKESKYIDIHIGIIAAIFCGILAILMLFVTPVLGVADDGTLSRVMEGAALDYPYGVEADSSYFVKDYIRTADEGGGYVSAQTVVIYIAETLDSLFTSDRVFDIRFLGLVYTIMFIPAVLIFVKGLSERVDKFSQKIVILIMSVFILGDLGYITYFNSFYAEALIYICLLYISGAMINLQKESKYDYMWFGIFIFFTVLLCFIRQYCFIAGVLGMIFMMFSINRKQSTKWKVTTIVSTIFIGAVTLGSLIYLEDDFNEADKLHSMTRGVLMQSTNPEDTLEEFGINQSYSMLTDVSSYDVFPMTTTDNSEIQEGFLDKYNSFDILTYYFKHPSNMLSMLEISANNNMTIAKEHCGNYLESQGMPEGARSVFWSQYSNFKKRSLPHTIGYLIILFGVLVTIISRGVSNKKGNDLKNRVFLECVVILTAFTILSTCFIIVRSGETALIQYNGQLGIITDFLLIFTVTEILEIINIF